MLTRRRLLAFVPGAAALVACGAEARLSPTPAATPGGGGVVDAAATATPSGTGTGTAAATAAPPTPSPTPSPPPPTGTTARLLLAGTPNETEAIMTHSGVRGPVLMVLGGVHGNEPGGWMAAQEVAGWTPAAGSLVVVPMCNVVAIAGFLRTTDELGDLNRLYPGDPASPLPMARMAAEVVALANEFGAAVLLDLHESWAFYVESDVRGTATLGQTVTAGIGPRNPALTEAVVGRVNGNLTVARDRLILRDGAPFRADVTAPATGGTTTGGRGRSSLGLSGVIDGLTPILVEMGQQDQSIARRTELHLAVVRATMAELGMA